MIRDFMLSLALTFEYIVICLLCAYFMMILRKKDFSYLILLIMVVGVLGNAIVGLVGATKSIESGVDRVNSTVYKVDNSINKLNNTIDRVEKVGGTVGRAKGTVGGIVYKVDRFLGLGKEVD